MDKMVRKVAGSCLFQDELSATDTRGSRHHVQRVYT